MSAHVETRNSWPSHQAQTVGRAGAVASMPAARPGPIFAAFVPLCSGVPVPSAPIPAVGGDMSLYSVPAPPPPRRRSDMRAKPSHGQSCHTHMVPCRPPFPASRSSHSLDTTLRVHYPLIPAEASPAASWLNVYLCCPVQPAPSQTARDDGGVSPLSMKDERPFLYIDGVTTLAERTLGRAVTRPVLLDAVLADERSRGPGCLWL